MTLPISGYMIGRVETMTPQYRYVVPANAFETFPAEAVEQSLPERFAAQVCRFGDRVAVRTRAEAITYADLDRLANGVAHAVLDARGAGSEPVALLLDKGIAQIAAFLGALKAGKIVTPLDPVTPPGRLRGMLERGMTPLVLVDAERLAETRAVIGAHATVLPVGRSTGSSDRDPARAPAPDAPALIVHTSGSTGHPRGVLHTHRAVLRQARRLTNRYHLGVDDRLTWLAALSTSQGVSNVLLALLNGATLYPWDIRQDGLSHLARWMWSESITFYRSSTSVFRYFVDHLTGTSDLPSLRLLALGSEPAYAEDVERFRWRFPPTCLLANVLSCSEAWTMAMHLMDGDSPLPDGPVPVGIAAEGVEILLLDAAGAPAPEGEPGEIAVRSESLALGYWRAPELSRAVFGPEDAIGRPAPIYRTGDLGRFLPDGSLVLLGRRDFQVKVRGHRVELEEVERALRGHAGIRAAAVVARADARNETALVGYVVPDEAPGPSVTALSLFLRERLPSHMIPAVIVAVEALPVTAAGKVDRRALPAPERLLPSRALILPRTPIETRVAAIWADVLGVESVGVEDDFLTLGGNSLLATMVIARIAEEFGLGLSMAALLQVPTVAEMAVLIVVDLMARLPEGGADELSAPRDA